MFNCNPNFASVYCSVGYYLIPWHDLCIDYCVSYFLSTSSLPYLCEKRLVNLHALIGALRQDLSPTMPAVADRWVGIGHAAQKHSPLIVELLLSFSYALVHCHHWVIKVCGLSTNREDETVH